MLPVSRSFTLDGPDARVIRTVSAPNMVRVTNELLYVTHTDLNTYDVPLDTTNSRQWIKQEKIDFMRLFRCKAHKED